MLNDLLSVSLLDIDTELFKRRQFTFIAETKGKIHLKQAEALSILTDKTTTEFTYGGAAGGAKSWTGCAWLLFMCLGYPGTKWFIGREELKRLRESTLLTFFKVCQKHGVRLGMEFKYNGQDHYIHFKNGSRIDLLDLKYNPSDPLYERYGSVEYTGGWIEEGGEVNIGAYDTLKSRIGRHMNDRYGILRKLFITCNPKKNWLYTVFYKPFKEGKLQPHQRFLQALYGDNPHGEAGYGDALKSITDPAKKQRLLFGNWEYDDDPMKLMDYDAIQDLWTNSFVASGERFITADIALQGSDCFVVGVWDGLRLIDMVVLGKSDGREVEDTIRTYASLYQVPRSNIVYDSDGVGSYLQGYLKGAKPFHNGARALHEENYRNLKTQCYYKLAELVNANKVYIQSTEYREQMIQELEQVKRVESNDGKLMIADKETIRDTIGRSPDLTDMLMMRMLFEVKPKGSFTWRSSSKT